MTNNGPTGQAYLDALERGEWQVTATMDADEDGRTFATIRVDMGLGRELEVLVHRSLVDAGNVLVDVSTSGDYMLVHPARSDGVELVGLDLVVNDQSCDVVAR